MSEVHYFGLPMSLRSTESGLPFIARTNANVVISGPDIKLGEQHMPLKFLSDVFNIWDRVLIPNCPVVDGSVVLYWAIGPILLFDTKVLAAYGDFDGSMYPLASCSSVHSCMNLASGGLRG